MSKITVDELKVFVGTGLDIVDGTMGTKTLIGVDHKPYGTYVTLSDNTSVPIAYIKPIVRPLSKLAEVIEHNGEKFIPVNRLYGSKDMATSHPEKQEIYAATTRCEISEGSIEYAKMIKLASWHFDIHFWLEKTGEDGQPLAIEKQ